MMKALNFAFSRFIACIVLAVVSLLYFVANAKTYAGSPYEESPVVARGAYFLDGRCQPILDADGNVLYDNVLSNILLFESMRLLAPNIFEEVPSYRMIYEGFCALCYQKYAKDDDMDLALYYLKKGLLADSFACEAGGMLNEFRVYEICYVSTISMQTDDTYIVELSEVVTSNEEFTMYEFESFYDDKEDQRLKNALEFVAQGRCATHQREPVSVDEWNVQIESLDIEGSPYEEWDIRTRVQVFLDGRLKPVLDGNNDVLYDNVLSNLELVDDMRLLNPNVLAEVAYLRRAYELLCGLYYQKCVKGKDMDLALYYLKKGLIANSFADGSEDIPYELRVCSICNVSIDSLQVAIFDDLSNESRPRPDLSAYEVKALFGDEENKKLKETLEFVQQDNWALILRDRIRAKERNKQQEALSK